MTSPIPSVRKPKPVSIGLVLTGAYEPSADPRMVMAQQVELAQAAEAAGFDSVWMGEHYLGADSPWLQNIPFMSYLAGHTRRLRLGLFVIAPLHGLLELAEQLATLDIVSGGRAEVCFVRGWRKKEFASFGVPYATAGTRLEEDADLILRLWRGEEVTIAGLNRFDRVRIGARPVQLPDAMLFMGGSSEHVAAQAGVLGRPFIHSSHVAIEDVEALMVRYRNAGGTSRCSIVRQCYVAESNEIAVEEASPIVGAYYQVYADWGLSSAPAVTRTFQAAAPTRFIVGDPDTCVAKVREYVARLDASAVLCRIGWPGLSQAKTLRAIELIGSQVIPKTGHA